MTTTGPLIGAAAAALVVGLAAPATSATFDVSLRAANFLTLNLPFVDEPTGGASAEVSEGVTGVSTSVEIDGLGMASNAASGSAFLTNPLDEEISGVLNFLVNRDVFVSFDSPDERVGGTFQATLTLGDRTFDFDFPPILPGSGKRRFGPADFGCEDTDCFRLLSQGTTVRPRFTLGPGESVPIEIDLAVTAIAAIPLPAAFGPFAIALGGLAWIGRRKLVG